MFIDRVEVSFDAAHRLLDYDGKCASPHGHTYRAEVFVARERLNALGLAIDFGDVKQPLKRWIDEQWDHAFLLNSDDHQLLCGLRAIPESKLYCFPSQNPSAEVMAETLFCVLRGHLNDAVQSVRIWEGGQYAEYVPDTRTLSEAGLP